MGERLINHIDETFESIVGKALRSECLYTKSKIEVAFVEEPKSQANGGGKNGSKNKRSRTRIRTARKRIRNMLSASAVVRRAIMLVIVGPSQRIGSASTVAKWDITRTSVRNPPKKSKW